MHALDDSLGEARWSDAWKLDAILLQVQWRCKEEGADDVRHQRGDEALAMIDEAVAAQPAIMLYALRVQSALAAHRSDAIVESIWEYGHGLFASGLPDRQQTQAALNELVQLLGKQTGATDSTRLEEVRGRLLDDVRDMSYE